MKFDYDTSSSINQEKKNYTKESKVITEKKNNKIFYVIKRAYLSLQIEHQQRVYCPLYCKDINKIKTTTQYCSQITTIIIIETIV